MLGKLDIELCCEPDAPPPSDARVGQAVLIRQADDGLVAETEAGVLLGRLPPAAAAAVCGSSSQGCKAAIRSIKRAAGDNASIVGLQVRVSLAAPAPPTPLVQAEPPPEDPANFSLTTSELERLAYDEGFRTTLKDRRLQELLQRIDGSPNREQALKQALEQPGFRQFADQMLGIMKPADYPAAAAEGGGGG